MSKHQYGGRTIPLRGRSGRRALLVAVVEEETVSFGQASGPDPAGDPKLTQDGADMNAGRLYLFGKMAGPDIHVLVLPGPGLSWTRATGTSCLVRRPHDRVAMSGCCVALLIVLLVGS